MRMIFTAPSRLLPILAGLIFLAAGLGATAATAGYAHFVVDATSGEVLAAENADVINHPASLTKMMTLYLAFEAIAKGQLGWDQQIIMTPNAAGKIPYKLGIGANKPLTVREAVNATAIRSANDAAQAIGDHLGGSEENFARMMTMRARSLGMSRTVFRNASGLPDAAQVTTARDMAVLAAALIRDYPQEYRIFSQRSFAFRGRTIRGHNNLMYRYAGMDGVKTGYVTASGFNLVSAVNDNGRRVIGVVLGGKSARSRDSQMETLLDRALGRDKTLLAGTVVPGGAKAAPAAPTKTEAAVQAVQAARAEQVASDAPTGPELPGVVQPEPASALAGKASPSARDRTEIAALAAPASDPAVHAGGWRVQVATSGDRSAASRMLTRAQAILADHFGRLAPLINEIPGSRGAATFRAQLVGFGDRKRATDACSALRRYAVECSVLSGAS